MVRRLNYAHYVGAFLKKPSQKVLVNRLIYIKTRPGTAPANVVLHKLFLLFQLDL